MRNNYERKIYESLALLGTPGKIDKLIGCDGDSGDAFFLKIALVNYQP